MIRQKGSILILILWVLIILSLLSIAISYRASGDIKLAKYESENIKALYLAKAGIAKMIAELNKDDKSYTSLNGEWAKEKEFNFGGGNCLYGAYDEEARFNFNSLNLKVEHLNSLLGDSVLSDKMFKYRKEKIDKGSIGFEFMEELFLIDGMPKDVYENIKDYVTIYRGNEPKVNINTSSDKILHVILGENTFLIDKISGYIKGNDGERGTEDDGVFTDDNFSLVFAGFGVTPADIVNYQGLFGVKSNFFRVWAEASFSEDKKIIKRITAVADRSGKIYYWKEE